MSKIEKLNEEEVFKQDLDDEELEGVVGGDGKKPCKKSPKVYHCYNNHHRDRQTEGCAASVEDWSLCSENDACFRDAVMYDNMKSCAKANL